MELEEIIQRSKARPEIYAPALAMEALRLRAERDQLRAELAVLRGRIADDAELVSEYTLLLRDAYNLCNPAWPWMHGFRERIRAALAGEGETK